MLSELQPVTIRGSEIYLEPLERFHANELYTVGKEPIIWRFQPKGPFESEDDAEKFIDRALSSRRSGNEFPFVIRLCSSNQLIGTTRYRNIDPRNCSVETGFTFIHPSHWWRGAGSEAVFLLADYAFEKLEANRVWMMTDTRNYWTQKALDRMGIVREGVLRRHLRVSNGFIRDSVIYSVIADEWPAAKQEIRTRLCRLQNRRNSRLILSSERMILKEI